VLTHLCSSALPLPALILFMCDASDSFNKAPDDLHEDRQSKRVPTKVPGSLVVAPDYENLRRIPCLIIDVSPSGFRLRASGRLRRGQVVEVLSDSDPFTSVECRVIWVGKAGSKEQGEAGLQII